MEFMLYVYIASLIVGGAVVLVAALSSLGGEPQVISRQTAAGSASRTGRARCLFFSAFFFGFGGLMGGLLLGPLGTLATALAAGALCGWWSDWMLTTLHPGSPVPQLDALGAVGRRAVVTRAAPAGRQGAVSVTLDGGVLELPARHARDGSALTEGDVVEVLSVRGGVAAVLERK